MKGFTYPHHLAAIVLMILSLTLTACGGGDSASPPNVTGVYNGTITTGAGDSYPVEAAILGNRLLGYSIMTGQTNVIFDFQLNVDSAGVVTGVSATVYETHKPDWEYIGHFSESPALSGSAQERVGVTIDFSSDVYGDDVQMVLTFDAENSGKSPSNILSSIEAGWGANFYILQDPINGQITEVMNIFSPVDPANDYLLEDPQGGIVHHEGVMSVDEVKGILSLTESVDIEFVSGIYTSANFSGFLFAATDPESPRTEMIYIVTDGTYANAAFVQED